MAVQSEEPPSSDSEDTSSTGGGASAPPIVEKPILYIDRHRLTRDCIAHELSIHLPGIAIECIETAAELAAPEVAARRFGLAVLHAHMARVGEASIGAQLLVLARAAPRLPLVLLSDVDEMDAIAEAFRFGVRGYITTRQSMRDAAKIIRFVSAGGVVVPWSALAESTGSEAEGRAIRASLPVKFTRRQLDVLTRLWQGKPNKAIAFELDTSESTVKTHIQSIMHKLGAANRTQVVLMTRPPAERGDLGSGAAWLRRH